MLLNFPTAMAHGQGALLAGNAFAPKLALTALAARAHLTCHSGFLIERLAQASDASKGVKHDAYDQKHRDVAELFAFVCPAQGAVPTVSGLGRALGLHVKNDAAGLEAVVAELLRRLTDPRQPHLRPRE